MEKTRSYIAEFIGTFFLVFTVGVAAVLGGAGPFAPLAIGSVLMVMIFAMGHVSGGHFNPAVTVGVWLRGKLPVADVVPYIVSQGIGAVVAALTVKCFAKATDKVIEVATFQPHPALLAEFLFTFALVFVMLNVATAKAAAGNSYFGLAIGFTVVVGAFTVGGISGGAFNPAVVVGLITMGKLAASCSWIHFTGNFAGAVVAAIAFKAIHPAGE